MSGNLPVGRFKPRGFRLFGREVQDYSETAAMALLLHVIGRLNSDGRAMLTETVRTLGRLGLMGEIKMRNHPDVAMTAMEEAIAAHSEGRGGDDEIPSSGSQQAIGERLDPAVESGLLRDSDWKQLDGEICRVIEFRPLAGRMEGGKVKSSTMRMPYAAIDIESPILAEPTTGFITHKLDFQHLWEAFSRSESEPDTEVLVIYNKSNLSGPYRWLPRGSMPGLVVWLCHKNAYDLMNDENFRPELEGSARFEAMTTFIEEWRPDVYM